MKRKLVFISTFILSLGLYAQGEIDAYKLSNNDLTGTARSVAMGGAFGALGGDVSAIAINPAGIGVYRSSEVVTTLNFQNVKTETNLNMGKFEESKFKFNFNNLAFVSSLPIDSDIAPYVNFGFSYNRLKNFDRKYTSRGEGLQSSMTDYMAAKAFGYTSYGLSMGDNPDAWKNDWLPVLGYNSFLINEVSTDPSVYESALPRVFVENRLHLQEKGGIDSYDFNLGTTFNNKLSIGMTLGVTDINYRLYSDYNEWFDDTDYGFRLQNWLKTEGTGLQVKAGVIYKPIEELRVGVSYHSPTWYDMTDFYEAELRHDITGLTSDPDYPNGGEAIGNYSSFDYEMRTPDKWTFSAAGVIGQSAIISVDYELTNYKNMRLHDRDGYALESETTPDPNWLIKQDFRNSSTLRVGAEVRFTPQFSGRVGYAWMQNPLKSEFKNNEVEVFTVGSMPHYTLDGDVNHFTWGLGYRFSRSFYTDIAFVIKSQKSDLYSFAKTFGETPSGDLVPMYDVDKAKLKTNTFQGMLTLGYKF